MIVLGSWKKKKTTEENVESLDFLISQRLHIFSILCLAFTSFPNNLFLLVFDYICPWTAIAYVLTLPVGTCLFLDFGLIGCTSILAFSDFKKTQLL